MGRRKILDENQVFYAIRRFIRDNGMPPTIEELRKELKVGSTRTVLRYLKGLEGANVIRRWSGARGIMILDEYFDRTDRTIPTIGLKKASPLNPNLPADPSAVIVVAKLKKVDPDGESYKLANLVAQECALHIDSGRAVRVFADMTRKMMFDRTPEETADAVVWILSDHYNILASNDLWLFKIEVRSGPSVSGFLGDYAQYREVDGHWMIDTIERQEYFWDHEAFTRGEPHRV